MLSLLSLLLLHTLMDRRDMCHMLLLYAVQVLLRLFPDQQSRRYGYDRLYNPYRHYGSGRQVLFRLPADGLSECGKPHRFRLWLHRHLRSCLLPLLL